MAGLFDPNKPALLQTAAEAFDRNKPALLQGRGVDAAQRALELQRAAELARQAEMAKAALTNGARSFTPSSAAWTSGQALDGWGASRTMSQNMGGLLRAATGTAATGVQAALYSPDAQAAELTQEQKEALMGPENTALQKADAGAYAQRIQDNARMANQPPGGPVSLMDPNAEVVDAQADIATDVAGNMAAEDTALANNEAPVATPTPAGMATQAAPANVEQAAAATAQQQESQRQQLERGALTGLSTGAVSRPKFAEAVVEADLARTGQQLTPEATKKAVTQELTNMKSMDDADLSRYISYALMAGGILAALLDKSGNAAEAFNQSFNKQLDRNLAYGLATQKQKAAQAKLDQEMSIQQGNWKRDDRGLDIKAETVTNTANYQNRRADIAEDSVKLGYVKEGRQASQGSQGLGLRAQALQMQQANADRNYELAKQGLGLRGEANAIRAAEAAAKGAKTPPGVALTEKGAAKVVQDFADSQGIKVDSNAKSALASQIQQASKNDPQWATDPAKVITRLLGSGGYEPEVDPGIPLVPFTGGGTRVRQKKQ